MATPSIDLTNDIEWNLITRQSLTTNGGERISNLIFTTESQELVIDIYHPDARSSWKYGGLLKQFVGKLPSSTAGTFHTPLVEVGRYPLTIKNYKGIVLVDASPKPYVCSIEFPLWLFQVVVEVWHRTID